MLILPFYFFVFVLFFFVTIVIITIIFFLALILILALSSISIFILISPSFLTKHPVVNPHPSSTGSATVRDIEKVALTSPGPAPLTTHHSLLTIRHLTSLITGAPSALFPSTHTCKPFPR